MIKYCPDLTGKETHVSVLIGGGSSESPRLNKCIENECVAYKKGKCLKYNNKVKIKKHKEEEEAWKPKKVNLK